MRLNSPIFFSCGCGGASPSGDSPVSGGGTWICDDRYLALSAGARMRLLGVTLGSNCQAFLGGSTPGFVFFGADGQAFIEDQPELTLPAINPAVSGVFPKGPNFGAIIISNGADPQMWYRLQAPSADEYVLTAQGGVWTLKPPGTAAAQTAVCSTDGAVTKGNLVVCKQTGTDGDGNSTYSLRKLAVVQDHLLVGNIDGSTGEIGYEAIPDTDPIKHTLSKIVLARSATFKQFDAITGNDESGGMAIPSTFGGTNDVTDAVAVLYSPANSKFYRRPTHLREHLTVDGDVAVADNGSWVDMGGHCLFANKTFNYTAFLISATIRIRAAGVGGTPAASYNNVVFGLFIDGILANTWDTKNGQDIALSWVHTALARGTHTVEIKFQQAADPDSAMTVKFSSALLITLDE